MPSREVMPLSTAASLSRLTRCPAPVAGPQPPLVAGTTATIGDAGEAGSSGEGPCRVCPNLSVLNIFLWIIKTTQKCVGEQPHRYSNRATVRHEHAASRRVVRVTDQVTEIPQRTFRTLRRHLPRVSRRTQPLPQEGGAPRAGQLGTQSTTQVTTLTCHWTNQPRHRASKQAVNPCAGPHCRTQRFPTSESGGRSHEFFTQAALKIPRGRGAGGRHQPP